MKKKAIFLVSAMALAALFFSCNTQAPREVIINDAFKMQIPAYMRSQKNLNETATMVYASAIKEIYAMVIEDKAEHIAQIITDNNLSGVIHADLDGFSKLAGGNEGEFFLTPADLDKLKDGVIHNLKAKLFENTRKINGVTIYYKIALVEGENTYYQVIVWTLADRKAKHEEILENMLRSFEEV